MATKEQLPFGGLFKARRMALGKSLREFAFEHGYDPGNLSKLERGIMPPPQDSEKIEGYARSLGIEKNSPQWVEFFDLAFAENGRIPEDLCDKELLRKLPVIFRTLRGQKVSEKALHRLAERLRSE